MKCKHLILKDGDEFPDCFDIGSVIHKEQMIINTCDYLSIWYVE